MSQDDFEIEQTEFYHSPVMLEECVSNLIVDPSGIYVDGTLGGGGHSKALLERLAKGGRVIGIDRDQEAIDRASRELASFGERFTPVKGRFSQIKEILEGLKISGVDGILLDLGVSSRQLDSGERGFSFLRQGPLDMRMDPTKGKPASELINEAREEELLRIFRVYGEEPRAKAVARGICNRRKTEPFLTTKDFADFLEKLLGRHSQKHPGTKVFQAVRIAVNDEMGELSTFLNSFIDVLKPGGRLAVISYHSLEDRMVKEKMRELEPHCTCPKSSPVCNCGYPGVLKAVSRKALKPTDDETKANPRARSAKLRVAQKI